MRLIPFHSLPLFDRAPSSAVDESHKAIQLYRSKRNRSAAAVIDPTCQDYVYDHDPPLSYASLRDGQKGSMLAKLVDKVYIPYSPPRT